MTVMPLLLDTPRQFGRFAVQVTVKSSLTPPVQFDPFADDPAARRSSGTVGDFLLGMLRPAFYLETPVGVVAVEPWGKPIEGGYRWVAVGLGVLAVVLVGVAVRRRRRNKKRRRR